MATLPEPVWSALFDDEAPLTAPAGPDPHQAGGPTRALVVRDTDLPLLRGSTAPLHVVVTGGAGQVAGPAGLGTRLGLAVVGLEIALRDLDDLAGNARRVVTAVDRARSDGVLDEDVPVHVELPGDEPTHGWMTAADELAAAELRLTLRVSRPGSGGPVPAALLATWIDAALDRETPFRCTDLRRGARGLLVATRLAFDGASRDDVVAALGSADGAALGEVDLAGTRRWVTSLGSPDVGACVAELRDAGVLW